MQYLQSQWRLGNVGWQHNFSFSSWSRSENEILESKREIDSQLGDGVVPIGASLIAKTNAITYLISTRKTRVQGQNQQVWKLKQSGCIINQNLQLQAECNLTSRLAPEPCGDSNTSCGLRLGVDRAFFFWQTRRRAAHLCIKGNLFTAHCESTVLCRTHRQSQFCFQHTVKMLFGL